ncbi:pseudouridine synthase [Scleroderma yunnanense]
MTPNYDAWSKQDLIARINDIEQRLKRVSSNRKPIPSPTGGRPFHFEHHPRRKIAVKFCYSGWEYNGLAFQDDPTPLPTVEEVLFRAFAKARLVDPHAGLDGCGWERCGRTDVGVSAAGQVVSLWVRSVYPGLDAQAPPHAMETTPCESIKVATNPSLEASGVENMGATPDPDGDDTSLPFSDLLDASPSSTSKQASPPPERELHYVSILNRILPPTIRVLAWSPVSPTFSARFNCRQRHYKYFFTSHGLDIPLMQQAADYLVGEHDFRNLSKLDPAKQITDFRRRILSAQINVVTPSLDDRASDNDQLYVLDLVGNAFLYHQVRHIMAILFMVGTGLEPPSIIPTLTNVDGSESARTGLNLPIVDRKPEYQMADALPLMLWDCAFNNADVKWQTHNDSNCSDNVDESRGNEEKHSGTGLIRQLHSVCQRSLIHCAMEGHFLSAAGQYHPRPPQYFPFTHTGLSTSTIPRLPNNTPPVIGVPLGGGTYRRGVKYVPLLSRKRLDHVMVVNERWRNGKGSRRIETRTIGVVAGDGDE